ncbi:hypothetical protein DA717_07545, partial [Piscirickettsiaceae bacterium NZ-RLO2]
MLSFLEAYFLNYVEKGLAEIDGEKKGSLLQKLNAKLSFLSSLESTFRARFDGDLIKKFYVNHSSILNEAERFDFAGECSKSYLSLFKAFEEAGNKDRRPEAVKLDKFSNTEVVCDSSDVFSAEQVDGLNHRINLGKQNFFYGQLKAKLYSRENHLGTHVKALMESGQYSDLRAVHREMYLYAEYMANALNSDKYQATRLLNFSYDRLYSLMNSDIANFMNQHKHMDVAKLNQFLTKQCLKYQTVLESTMMSCLLAAPSAALREDRDGWLVANTDSTMWVASRNNMTGQLTCVKDSFEGLALDRPKVVQRLNALQELTKERLMRYEMDYKQENLGELVRAVVGDYAMGGWRWKSHFKGQGQGFLQECRELLHKVELTLEDKKNLLVAVQMLQMQIYASQSFSPTSSFSIRLAFLERKVAEQIEAEFDKAIVGISDKLRYTEVRENLIEEINALQVIASPLEVGSCLFNSLNIQLKQLEARVGQPSMFSKEVVKEHEHVVEMEGTREALMMQSVLSQPAVQAESAPGYSS